MPDETTASVAPPKAPPATLEYQTPPPKWKRWGSKFLHGSAVVGSHFVAVVSAFVILTVFGVVFMVISNFVMIFAPKAGTGGDGFLEITVSTIVAAIIGWLCGALAWLPAIFCGIIVDSIRRPFKISWWLTLLIIALLIELACLVIGAITKSSLLVASGWGACVMAFFCVYWIPLGCTEGILRLMKWGMPRVFIWLKRKIGTKPIEAPAAGSVSPVPPPAPGSP